MYSRNSHSVVKRLDSNLRKKRTPEQTPHRSFHALVCRWEGLIHHPRTLRISQSWRPLVHSGPTWGHPSGPGWPGLSEVEGLLRTSPPTPPRLLHTEAGEQSPGSHLLGAASGRLQTGSEGGGCFQWLKIRKGNQIQLAEPFCPFLPSRRSPQNLKGDCVERGELGVPPFSSSSFL